MTCFKFSGGFCIFELGPLSVFTAILIHDEERKSAETALLQEVVSTIIHIYIEILDGYRISSDSGQGSFYPPFDLMGENTSGIPIHIKTIQTRAFTMEMSKRKIILSDHNKHSVIHWKAFITCESGLIVLNRYKFLQMSHKSKTPGVQQMPIDTRVVNLHRAKKRHDDFKMKKMERLSGR